MPDDDSRSSRLKSIEAYEIFLQSPLGGAMRREALRRLADQIIEYLEEEETRLVEESVDNPDAGIPQTSLPENYTYERATKLYQEAISTFPKALGTEHILYQLARAYEANGEPKNALKALDTLLKDYPNSAYAAAIPVFVHKALQDEPPVIFGDGEQTRDFIFIEDVIEANLKACEAGPEANGQVFNIGTGKSVTINALCNRILELLGKDLTPSHGPMRKGDVLHSLADIEKARRVFGFSPKFDVMTGLEKSIGWYRENL